MTIPTLTPVRSSMLAAIHHNPETRLLTVRYNTGAHYEHAGVPPEKVTALMKAESMGKHFNELKKAYPATRGPF